jgi:hypothetical protein
LIQSAAPNTTRVDYTQGAELTPTVYQRIGYTDFSSGWGAFGGFTVQSASDFGGQPAIRLVSDGTSSNYYQFEIQNTEAQQQYVFSFYCRRVSGSGDIAARHALSVTGSSTSITVTANWQRVSVTCLGRTGGGSIFVGLIQSTGDGVYEFSQPQVEEGTTASSFVANTTGSPKFITGATYGPRVPMILVEPSSENLLVESNAFFNSADATKTTGIDAPDGTNTAINIGNILAGTSDRANSSYAIVTGSTDYSGSVYVRGNAGDVVALYIKRVAGSFVSSPIRHVTLTGDWQRVENINITTLADNTQLRLFVYKDNSVTADSVDLWGGQIETGSVSTSVIPTSGSTVTRAADDLEITGSAFDFYNQSEGTIYTEFIPRRVDYYQHLYEFSDGGSTNRINVHFENGNARFYLTSGGTVYANTIAATNVTTGELHRTGFSYKTNDAPASFDGSTEITDITVTVPSGIDRVFLGALYTQANDFYLNGHIKRVLFWPYHSDRL